MRLTVRLVALALSAAAVPALADLAGSPPRPFALAVVRRDGVLVPFATYAGRKWKATWPQPGREGDVPLTTADVPRGWWGPVAPTAPWEFWPAGGSRQPLKIVGTSLFYPHCQSNIGLRSDYRAAEPVPPATEHHHPKDGMAIAGGPVPVDPIETLPESAPEWTALAEAIASHIGVAEESVLSATVRSPEQNRGGIQAILTQALRAATPLEPEVLCRSPGPKAGSAIYYFEAAKRYQTAISRLGLRSTAVPEAFFWGFVHMADGSPPGSYIQAVLTTSRARPRTVTYTTPLAMIRVEDVPLWVVQRAGFGWEEYSVLDLSKPKPVVLIATFGGGC